jgi:hypothetical protein
LLSAFGVSDGAWLINPEAMQVAPWTSWAANYCLHKRQSPKARFRLTRSCATSERKARRSRSGASADMQPAIS